VERHLTPDADSRLVRDLKAEEITARQPKPPDEVGPGQIRAAMIHLEIAADEEALDALVIGVIDALPTEARKRQWPPLSGEKPASSAEITRSS
jgi:hypothetical protein